MESEKFETSPLLPTRKVQLPSEQRPKIPPSPHRPSLDTFWDQEATNNWNDHHSPQKTPKSNRVISLEEDDEFAAMPPTKSPTKKDKQALERKKLFDSTKQELATSFLEDLDKTIAGGQLALLSQATGGIKIVWSKKLKSTAGRANWKREVTRNRNPDGAGTGNTTRHHASIELAEKVIDDEDRLLNVVAHEFCHLANFMVSNVKDQPHGASFKQW